MALIVEDGTSKIDAESYVSVAEADDHFSLRGIVTWSVMNSTEKEQAIRRATDYMSEEYTTRWNGHKTQPSQALQWPRAGVYVEEKLLASDFVPREVKRACIELALKAAAGELTEDIERPMIEETIGPITTKWSDKSSPKIKYVKIDNMLRAYLGYGDSSIMAKLVRT